MLVTCFNEVLAEFKTQDCVWNQSLCGIAGRIVWKTKPKACWTFKWIDHSLYRVTEVWRVKPALYLMKSWCNPNLHSLRNVSFLSLSEGRSTSTCFVCSFLGVQWLWISVSMKVWEKHALKFFSLLTVKQTTSIGPFAVSLTSSPSTDLQAVSELQELISFHFSEEGPEGTMNQSGVHLWPKINEMWLEHWLSTSEIKMTTLGDFLALLINFTILQISKQYQFCPKKSLMKDVNFCITSLR